MSYETLTIKPETKARFKKLGSMDDTQESVLCRLMDFYEKYHDYEEQIEFDMEQHGIFIGKFEGE